MKIKFEKEVKVNFRPGETADLPKDKAQNLIKKGFASSTVADNHTKEDMKPAKKK